MKRETSTAKSTKPNLLLCPFCGAKAKAKRFAPVSELPDGWWVVECVNTSARSVRSGNGCPAMAMSTGDTLEEVVRQWNTRAPVPTAQFGLRQLAAFVEAGNSTTARGRTLLLPAELVGYWCELCIDLQSRKRAWTTLVSRWRRGEPIPGYANTPLPGKHGLPAGWSYTNLWRLAPSKYELMGIRRGMKHLDRMEGGAS